MRPIVASATRATPAVPGNADRTAAAGGRRPRWTGRLYLWRGRALYVGPVHDTAPHAHHAVQLAFALDGTLRIHSRAQWRDCTYTWLRSDEEHQLSRSAGPVALVYLDPHSALAADLAVRAPPADPGPVAPALLQRLERCGSPDATIDDAEAATRAAVAALSQAAGREPRIDPRVARTIRYIDRLETKKVSLADAAREVGLSASRLGHLFRQQTGLPFRRYLLWLRLQDALAALAGGSSLTDAAHSAGFADSAHLSRTFRRNFGTTLSEAAAAATIVTVGR